MPLPLFIVDAFASRPFAGNPAAVCLLDGPRPDAWMQALAAEMNLSETAFLLPEGDGWRLRGLSLPVHALDLVAQIDRLLEQSVLDALAIARKAGLVAPGFGKAAAALEREIAVALLHAAEASPDGVRKLRAIAHSGPSRLLPVIEFLTSAQLDLALGRPNVVHAALLAGAASDTFLSRSRRLERFRTGSPGERSNRAGAAGPH